MASCWENRLKTFRNILLTFFIFLVQQKISPQILAQRSSSDNTDSASVSSCVDGTLELPPSMPPPKPPRFDGSPQPAPTPQRLSSILKQLSGADPTIPYITSPITSNYYEIPRTTLNDNGNRGMTYRVTLRKDPATNSFGFSVSDGAGDSPGVYINAILPGSPADRCGQIRPLDRILQV